MAKDVMRATSCNLCDPSPCDLRIRSAWVDEAHLASMWSIWAPMDKLDCSTTIHVDACIMHIQVYGHIYLHITHMGVESRGVPRGRNFSKNFIFHLPPEIFPK